MLEEKHDQIGWSEASDHGGWTGAEILRLGDQEGRQTTSQREDVVEPARGSGSTGEDL